MSRRLISLRRPSSFEVPVLRIIAASYTSDDMGVLTNEITCTVLPSLALEQQKDAHTPYRPLGSLQLRVGSCCRRIPRLSFGSLGGSG